ncbi:MAG: ATP-binding protein [Bacteroidales bacterium]|nr:ATP-binding protein [Bacteroidales bacterium]
MIKRIAQEKILKLLQNFPCVAIIGPRQVGKTTLAKQISKIIKNQTIYLDLELRNDYNKLLDAEFFFKLHSSKTIIIDEVQHYKSLFPILRGVIDADRKPGRFMLLGSASPELIHSSSETLAGRIAYIELSPFILPEIDDIDKLWIYGGFPDAFLNIPVWQEWMNNFVFTYIERDLPALGFTGGRRTAHRLWTMIAHNHGNLLNISEFSKSLEISTQTVKKYINFLEKAFLIRQIQPYYYNIKKRVVKSPKIYIRDSGILHYLLGLENIDDVFGHYKMGSSWENFVIEQIAAFISPKYKLYYYRTHDNSELDLVIEKGGKPFIGIEIKYGSNIKISKGNALAAKNLKTIHNFIIIKENEDYLLSNGFRVCGINNFLNTYLHNI